MVTDIFQMPVSRLSSAAENIIKRLNSKRLFFTEGSNTGLPRDWRGLATLVGLTTQDAENLCAMKVLEIWVRRDEDSKLHHLFHHLQTIDRHDLFDDLMELAAENRLIENTEKWSTGPRNTGNIGVTIDDFVEGRLVPYDAAVLHADAKPENEFTSALIEIMTSIGFRIVRKSDLLSDVMPLTAMTELINSRCRHIIFILSPAFSQSPDDQFLSQYVHAKKVDERSHQMILCEFKTCEPLKELRYYKPLRLSNPDFWWALAWNLNARRTPKLNIPPWVRSIRYTPANGHSSVTASACTVNGSVATGADTLVANAQTDGHRHRQRSATNVTSDRRPPPPNSNVALLAPNCFGNINARYASGCNRPVGNGLVVNYPVAGGFSENEFVADMSIADESVAIKCLANESVAEQSAADDSVSNDSIANGTVRCNKDTDGHLQQHTDTHSSGPGQLSGLQSQRPDAHPIIKHAILEDVAQWCCKRLNTLRNKLYPKGVKAQVTK